MVLTLQMLCVTMWCSGRIPTPLVIEAELALTIADAFGGEGTAQLVRERMMQANLTGCRFGWMGRRDRLFCHEALPIIEQILDEKSELLWSQAQAAANIGETQLASALQLVVGVAAFFAAAAAKDQEQGPRLNEDGLRGYNGWGTPGPTAQDLGEAWEVLTAVHNADSKPSSWVTLGDMLRTAVSTSAVFGQGESAFILIRRLDASSRS
jgi:hypothetical protein